MKYASAPLQDAFDMIAEEAVEIAKERMKAIRFGWDGCAEWIARGKDSPRTLFVQELGDLLAALDWALVRGQVTAAELEAAKQKKHARLKELFGMDIASILPKDQPSRTVVVADAVLDAARSLCSVAKRLLDPNSDRGWADDSGDLQDAINEFEYALSAAPAAGSADVVEKNHKLGPRLTIQHEQAIRQRAKRDRELGTRRDHTVHDKYCVTDRAVLVREIATLRAELAALQQKHHERGVRIIALSEHAGAHLCRAEKAEAELATANARVRELTTMLDNRLGTPCEQIRWQEERDELKAELASVQRQLSEARAALENIFRAGTRKSISLPSGDIYDRLSCEAEMASDALCSLDNT